MSTEPTRSGNASNDADRGPAPDDAPPRIADRFALGELIGRGSSAAVYVARDDLLGRDVAVKLFAGGAAIPARARAGREMRALAALDHPGIVGVYDVGEVDGRLYLVMQLVTGGSLAQRLEHGPLPLFEVLFVAAELLVALDHVHGHRAVHRDLGPSNILLDPEADPDGRDARAGPASLIADFGVASLVGATAVTAGGEIVGTAAYLAPEQVRGESVGPAADVYALGLVLLECLTGEREFPGGAVEASVARLHRTPEIPPELPATLSALLSDMTAFAPEERPTAAEALVRVRQAAAEAGLEPETLAVPTALTPTVLPAATEIPVSAHPDAPDTPPPDPPPELKMTGPGARRHRSRLALGATAAIALLAAAVAVMVFWTSPGDRPIARVATPPTPSFPSTALPPTTASTSATPQALTPTAAADPTSVSPAGGEQPVPSGSEQPHQPPPSDEPEQPGPQARLMINGGEPLSKKSDDEPQAYAECPANARPQALRTPYLGTPKGWRAIGGRGYWATLSIINAAPSGRHSATVDCGGTVASTTFVIR